MHTRFFFWVVSFVWRWMMTSAAFCVWTGVRMDGWMGLHFHTSLAPRLFSLWLKETKEHAGQPSVYVCVMTGRSSIYYPTHVVVIVVVVVVVAARSPLARSAFPF